MSKRLFGAGLGENLNRCRLENDHLEDDSRVIPSSSSLRGARTLLEPSRRRDEYFRKVGSAGVAAPGKILLTFWEAIYF